MFSAALFPVVFSGALDPGVSAWRSAILANGGSVSGGVVAQVNRFVRGCKADGVWDSLLDVGLFAGVDNLNAALVKLKTPAGVSRVLTNVNFVAADYTATGASAGLRKPSNTSARLETGLVSSTYQSVAGASFGVYATLMETSGTAGFIGVADVAAGTAAHSVVIQDSAVRRGAFGQNWTTPTNLQTDAASPAASGFEVLSRVSATSSIYYRNGTQTGSANTNTATGIAAGSVGLFSLRYGTGSYTHNNFSSMSARAYFIGTGLTATQVAALSARVNTLMAAFGANVY